MCPAITAHRSATTSNNQEYASLQKKYEQLETYFDPNYRAVWCVIKSKPIPVFTTTLLNNIRTLQNEVAKYSFENSANQPKYLIWQSDSPEVFSLGLDINYIYKLIIESNEKELSKYIDLCMDVLYINLMKLDLHPLITVTYLRGKALGGGFEAALSSDIVIAGGNVRCSFPEIRYNLLPSVGTLNMLLRRFSPSAMEQLLIGGKSVNSEQLLQLGLIHHVTNIDQGKHFIMSKIQEINPRHELVSSIYRAKTLNSIISYAELAEFKKNWLNTVLNLSSRNLKCLERLARAQHRYASKL